VLHRHGDAYEALAVSRSIASDEFPFPGKPRDSAKGLPVSMNVYFGFSEIIVSVRLKGRAIDANI